MNGKAHATATVALAACSLPFALMDARALVVGVGVLSGWVLDPDLDVDGWAGGKWRLRKLWKPLGWAYRTLWYPYEVFTAHRGISHHTIVGTLTRLLYLSPLLALWVKFGAVPWAALGLWAVGLCLNDLLHIMMDRRG